MKTIASLVLLFIPAIVLAEDPVLFHDTFKDGVNERWQPADPQAWKVITVDGQAIYSQFQQSKVKNPYRSPFNYNLVKDLKVTDFDLEVKVKSTVKDYAHRDVCLFFGYQDPAYLYYVHLAKKADDHANQIFIVNGADRKKISTKTTPGTNWTDAWHKIKVVRRVALGSIDVYFDDMKSPVMTAQDTTFTWGQVGIGTFDDTSDWAEVKVSGKKQ